MGSMATRIQRLSPPLPPSLPRQVLTLKHCDARQEVEQREHQPGRLRGPAAMLDSFIRGIYFFLREDSSSSARVLGKQRLRRAGRRHQRLPQHAGRLLDALTRVGTTRMPEASRRQTSAIKRLIGRLEGRQVTVAVGGSAVAIALGDWHGCAALVSCLGQEQGRRGC